MTVSRELELESTYSHPLRILVVDDNVHDFNVISRYISSGYPGSELIHAESGTSGLELINPGEERSWDCIFLDYMLPDMSGLEFLKKVVTDSNGNELDIVMLTGQGDERVSVKALRGGACDYLSKSHISATVLNSTLIHILESRELKRQLLEEQAQRIAAEKALRSQEMDKARLEAIKAAVARLMHEISNPLTGIIGLVQLMLENDESDKDLAMILEAALRIRSLTIRLDSLDKVNYTHMQLDQQQSTTIDSDPGEQNQATDQNRGTLRSGRVILDLPESSDE